MLSQQHLPDVSLHLYALRQWDVNGAQLLCRQKWLFKPEVSPANMPRMKEVASMSELAGVANQFEWTMQEASSYIYEMRDGIVRVFTDETRSEEPFVLPGTSFEFFSDMHRSVARHTDKRQL